MATRTSPKKVAVIGAGATGLLVAQGLVKNGFQVTVYERDPSLAFRDDRPVSFMIHWGFETLGELLPAELWSTIRETFCDPNLADDKESDGIKFYNAHTRELLFQAPPVVMRRVTRQKLRKHAARGLDIRWGATLTSLETQEGTDPTVVKIKFADGSEETADFVIGADGPRSKVRELLIGQEKSQLTKSDFVCGYTSAVLGRETADEVLNLHPIWVMSYHSKGICAVGSEDVKDPSDTSTWVFNITRIWRGDSPPINGPEAVKILKDNTSTFCEPFKSAVDKLTDDTPAFVRTLYYWRPIEWPNLHGRVTLAGDAAHPMLPFRGQGLNNALEDALKLVQALVQVANGGGELQQVIDEYDVRLRERGVKAVDTAVNEGALVQNMDRLSDMVVAKRGVARPE